MVPLLVLFTSATGYLFARWAWRVDRARLTEACYSGLEALGCWVAVYFANLLVGAVLVLLVRLLTGWFISVYVLGSAMLAFWSLLQALVFYHLWRQRR